MRQVRWTLSIRTWFSLLLLGIAIWLVAEHGRTVLNVCAVVFGAVLLGLAMRPLAVRLARRRIPRGVTVLLVYVVIAGLLLVMVVLVIPIVTSEVAMLQERGPGMLADMQQRIASTPWLARAFPENAPILSSLSQRLEMVLARTLGLAARLGKLLIELLIVVVLSYFFTTDVGLADRVMEGWIPDGRRDQVRRVLGRIAHSLAVWVWTQAIIALYAGVAFAITLLALGIPFAITIGLVGGMLEIIPYFGTGTALVLGLAAAVTSHPIRALWFVIAFTVIVEVKGHIIEPNLYGRVIGLHPALVVIALLVGAETAGIMGLLFAVPMAAVLTIIYHEVQADRAQALLAASAPAASDQHAPDPVAQRGERHDPGDPVDLDPAS